VGALIVPEVADLCMSSEGKIASLAQEAMKALIEIVNPREDDRKKKPLLDEAKYLQKEVRNIIRRECLRVLNKDLSGDRKSELLKVVVELDPIYATEQDFD
jgi:hypothetical protein